MLVSGHRFFGSKADVAILVQQRKARVHVIEHHQRHRPVGLVGDDVLHSHLVFTQLGADGPVYHRVHSEKGGLSDLALGKHDVVVAVPIAVHVHVGSGDIAHSAVLAFHVAVKLVGQAHVHEAAGGKHACGEGIQPFQSCGIVKIGALVSDGGPVAQAHAVEPGGGDIQSPVNGRRKGQARARVEYGAFHALGCAVAELHALYATQLVYVARFFHELGLGIVLSE